ncbi:Aste57867_383 [Aphanomyces stellatus]|uniref:Aste57867_383 protein n=1 Tax=Aphanomyces stellatus TaxID=120398 RepID=A0A485K7N5_9STRA|nr:hypothetical protein As57867_000382 [Aphanomyces stellatus]VFT77608.1 Aste57867_383 [Aphanomyces stellatus]
MWQSFVVIAIMVIVLLLAVYALRRYPFPSDATMVPEHSVYLVVFRAAVFLLFAIVLCGYSSLPHMFSYYTIWNFTLQTIYFAWAIKVQWCHRHHGTTSKMLTMEERVLSTYFDVLFSTSFLVCLVYWTILFPAKTSPLVWTSALQHGGNVVLLLLEFAMNGRTVRISSLGYMLLFPLLYGVFSWIGHETWQQGFWAYSFLDVSKTLSPAWYLGVCLVHTVFLFGAIGLSKLKWRLRPNNADMVMVETPDKYMQHA